MKQSDWTASTTAGAMSANTSWLKKPSFKQLLQELLQFMIKTSMPINMFAQRTCYSALRMQAVDQSMKRMLAWPCDAFDCLCSIALAGACSPPCRIAWCESVNNDTAQLTRAKYAFVAGVKQSNIKKPEC